MEAWGKRSKKMVTKGTGGRGKRMYKKKGMQKEEQRNESKYQMENATNIQKEGALLLLLYYY